MVLSRKGVEYEAVSVSILVNKVENDCYGVLLLVVKSCKWAIATLQVGWQ